MSVIWGTEASQHLAAIVASLDPEHPDPRVPRGYYESLTDWVCRFTDVRLDSQRMGAIALELTGSDEQALVDEYDDSNGNDA
jgi:hypothetical protein